MARVPCCRALDRDVVVHPKREISANSHRQLDLLHSGPWLDREWLPSSPSFPLPGRFVGGRSHPELLDGR